jgi:predicted TIM-barrel fold metal-dependent hydrolase
MDRCAYVYCGESLPGGATVCPVCRYPVNPDMAVDLKAAKQALPELPVPQLTDMHQIIPAAAGAAEAQLEMMETLHIGKALLQSVPTKVESMLGNKPLLELSGRYPGKFIVSHFMDPRHPRALARLRQYRERGVRVIKLLPCLGYQPDAPRWRRFFSTLEAEGQAAMVHTGFITARHKAEERKAGVYLNSRFGRPVYFDELARRHPGTQFIMCHTGGSLWAREAVEMVNQHENVWGDISGSGIHALRQICRERLAVRWEKLFWGNDSHPASYPYNLNLLLSVLREHGCLDRAPLLLHQNGKRFIETFLS